MLGESKYDSNQSMNLSYYKCWVTKDNKTEEYGYGLPYKDVLKEVKQFYKDGADAVELEMITKEEFDETLPRP